MRMPFSIVIADTDFEADIDVSLEWDGADPIAVVEDVTVSTRARRYSLLRHDDPDYRMLGLRIKRQAERDGDVLERLCEAEGVYHVGQPGDPDGHWRAVR